MIFLTEYTDQFGTTWCDDIEAESWEEAEKLCEGTSIKVIGKLIESIEVSKWI